VKGLTTGAGLWLAAAVGLAAGLGLWPLAVLSTGLALAVIRLLWLLEEARTGGRD
jgi:putative Mg2+ transporter-C (MgtC) family protein